MSVILSFIVVVLIISLLNKGYERNWDKHLSVKVKFDAYRIFEGGEIHLIETIRNQKFLPLPLLNVKFQISNKLQFLDGEESQTSDQYYRHDIFSLLMYQQITRTLPIACNKRGFFQLRRIDLTFDTLFNGTPQYKSLKQTSDIYVFPKRVNFNALDIQFRQVLGDIQVKRLLYEDPFTFTGIREYQSFDTMKSINWKASAKTNHLKVNVPSHSTTGEVTILLNLESPLTRTYNYIMEESIRLAATLALDLIANGISVSLHSNGCDLVTKNSTSIPAGANATQTTLILEALARIDLSLPISPSCNFFASYFLHQSKHSYIILISAYQREDLINLVHSTVQNENTFIWYFPTNGEYSFPTNHYLKGRIHTWELASQ